MSRKFFVFGLTLAFIWTSVAAFAQQPQNPAPDRAQKPVVMDQNPQETVRVGTAAVQVEAIVTDKSGRRINGLAAGDFKLVDEGAPQELDFFLAIEGSQARVSDKAEKGTDQAGNASSENPNTPFVKPFLGRYVALVFDDLNISPDNFLRSRRTLTDYVNNKLGEYDLVAVVATASPVGSLQQFTNDKQRILAALNRIASQSGFAERNQDRQFHITPAEAVRIDGGDEMVLNSVARRASTESLANEASATSVFAPDAGRGSAAAATSDTGPLKNRIRGVARNIVAQAGTDTRNLLNTLNNLFRGMADLPGRKIVVITTESFATLGGSTDDVSTQIVQMIELARKSGVSVYGVDAGGLRTQNTTATEYVTGTGLQQRTVVSTTSYTDFENLGAARALVAGTGGTLITNTNDLVAGLDRAMEDSSSYYVLGFKPVNLDNKFHRLAVTIKDRPDLIVRTRRGYLAVNQETVRGTETELVAALQSPVPRVDLPLEVVANAIPKASEQVVIVGLHVGHNYLTLPEASATEHVAAYEVLAWVFARGKDKPVGVVQHNLSYDLADAAVAQKLKSEGVVFVPAIPLTLPPGPYQIRAVVREKSTGAVGSAYQFFEIPDVSNSKVTSLSSIVLTHAGQTGFNGANSFKRGDDMELTYFIYNLPKQLDNLVQKVKLMDSKGRLLMDAPLPIAPGTNGSNAPQRTGLKVPNVRGRYAIVVELNGNKGKVELESRADFVVE
jgi:VWFA-related protein